MESNYFDIEDKKGTIHEDSLKNKLLNANEKATAEDLLEKNNLIKANISIFSNETNERTIFRDIQNGQITNINYDQENLFNNNNNKPSIIKIIPSLPQSNFKDIINPIIFSNSCLSTSSNYGDIDIFDNNYFSSNNQSQNISITSLYLNFSPKVEYNPIPEQEYYDDILFELLIEEKQNAYYKESKYIDFQADLDNKRRAELISFIYKMSKVFKFKGRTVFLAVQTMDRFFSKEKVHPCYYDLLCICSLVIASKFNEIYYPAFKDTISLFASDKNYTVKQALEMELLILKTINYNLFPIFPMFFFDIISKKCKLSNYEYYLGSLMIELIQFDFYLYSIKNSILAQAVFCKVISLTRKDKNPLEILKNIFPEENYESKENIQLFDKSLFVINELLQNLNAEYFVDIYQKYSQPDILGNSINFLSKL